MTLPLFAMAQTPTVQWTQSLGGSSSDMATDLIQTANGGSVMIGDAWSNNGQVFGAHGENDMWMVLSSDRKDFRQNVFDQIHQKMMFRKSQKS